MPPGPPAIPYDPLPVPQQPIHVFCLSALTHVPLVQVVAQMAGLACSVALLSSLEATGGLAQVRLGLRDWVDIRP